jgi:hypothetical protein
MTPTPWQFNPARYEGREQSCAQHHTPRCERCTAWRNFNEDAERLLRALLDLRRLRELDMVEYDRCLEEAELYERSAILSRLRASGVI